MKPESKEGKTYMMNYYKENNIHNKNQEMQEIKHTNACK